MTDAIYGAGYNSNGRFYEQSNDVLGMTPTTYRAGGANTEIRFAIGECSLGSILVAASERGVCSILIGDDPDALARDLQDRFPRAHLIGGDTEFEQMVAKVVGRSKPRPWDSTCRSMCVALRSNNAYGKRCAKSSGQDGELFASRTSHRCTEGSARRRGGHRGQSAGCRDPVPPCDSQ